jgi:hypothetical protein
MSIVRFSLDGSTPLTSEVLDDIQLALPSAHKVVLRFDRERIAFRQKAYWLWRKPTPSPRIFREAFCCCQGQSHTESENSPDNTVTKVASTIANPARLQQKQIVDNLRIFASALSSALDLQSRSHVSVILVVLEVGGTHPSEPHLCCRPIPPCVDCVFFGANERNVVLAASAPTSFLMTFLEVELGKASASALNAAPPAPPSLSQGVTSLLLR